jgi:hypothetical protein
VVFILIREDEIIIKKKYKWRNTDAEKIMGTAPANGRKGKEGIYIVVTHKEATSNTRERVKGRPARLE